MAERFLAAGQRIDTISTDLWNGKHTASGIAATASFHCVSCYGRTVTVTLTICATLGPIREAQRQSTDTTVSLCPRPSFCCRPQPADTLQWVMCRQHGRPGVRLADGHVEGAGAGGAACEGAHEWERRREAQGSPVRRERRGDAIRRKQEDEEMHRGAVRREGQCEERSDV